MFGFIGQLISGLFGKKGSQQQISNAAQESVDPFTGARGVPAYRPINDILQSKLRGL